MAKIRSSTNARHVPTAWPFLVPVEKRDPPNVGESRIPVPRPARPSFFPKSRVLEASRLLSGGRRSTIFSGCFQFVNTEDEPATPREKFTGFVSSTPSIKSDTTDQTFSISPVWDIDKNDVQQLVQLSEEKSSLFRLLEDSQLSMIEDVGDSCLVETNLGNYNETNATPHYLMLNKQNSFEHDESLGILTPDQMTDFTVALECSRTPSCENLTGSAGSKLALTRASASRPLAEEGCSERTPSPEELPLDPKPVEPIRSNTVPVSFVTSVTSITSLEAGYQGDGENSRPASRGADPPSIVPAVNLPAPCRQDPMTDSDFFTESDADAHEEIVRGDRKAQVIDGTLFCAPGERRCPSFTGEEMDSSGIYSDLDKLQAPEQAPEENDDHTPDTGDTELSQRSQPSPVAANVIMDYLQIPTKTTDETNGLNDTSSAEVPATKTVENNENIRPKTPSKADSVPLKKYKMPKKNVVSKIKAMIESSAKDDAEKEARRSQRSTRKGGRWDAVMNKIEAGKNEQRTRSVRKEVKSRVLQNLALSPSTRPTLKKAGDGNNYNNNNKDKRRMRGWQEMKSPTQETARSSVRSSMSDLSSGPSKDMPKRSPTSANPPRRFVSNSHANHQVRLNNFDAKKNCIDVTPVVLEKSPPSARKPAITRRLTANAPVKQKSSTPSIKDRESKEAHHNINYATTRTSPETRDQAAQTTVPYETSRAEQLERSAQALAVTVQYMTCELDAFTTPKLKRDFEQLKADYEKMRSERSAVLSEIDDLRTRYVSIEERLEAEREDHRKALDELRDDLEARRAEQVAALVETLKEERRKYDVRLNDATKEHRATIARLRAERDSELARKDAEVMRRSVVHDQGAVLRAEIESLRSVLELRSQENAALRSELDSFKRDIEDKDALQLRLDTVEARCEDLKAQLQCKDNFERQVSHENEMLHESIHQISKQNKRLAQRNEELQWRLRQKNEWVSVLANQLAGPRLSRSAGPEHTEHALLSDKSDAHSSSMVKFMVEKSDSVSWTLEIDDESSKGAASDSLSRLPKVSRSESGATVSRQGSLRLTPKRSPDTDTRARSKSISVTDATRVEENAWSPSFNSTPITRRRPRNNDASPSSSSSSSSSSASSSAPSANPTVAAAVAAAAVAAAAAEDCSVGQNQPQEAGGEAMISEETSASSSEDESSTGSDIPRLPMQFAWGKPIK